MKIKKIISKSKDKNRMEAITEHGEGILRTRHLHKGGDGKWRYFAGYDKNKKPIFRKLSTEEASHA